MHPFYTGNELFWDNCNLTEIANTVKTPVHVFSKRCLKESVTAFLKPFLDLGIPVKCYFSVKTNPVRGFLEHIKECGVGAEVISDYELWLARESGICDIIINGPAKSKDLLSAGATPDVKFIVLESFSELHRVKEVQCDKPLPIGIRICPKLGSFNPLTSSGAKTSPYGFMPEEVHVVCKEISKMDHVTFSGFQIYIGTGIPNSIPYKRSFMVLEQLLLKVKDTGCRVKYIDIGGGFGIASAPIMGIMELVYSLVGNKSVSHKTAKKKSPLITIAGELSRMLVRIAKAGIVPEKIFTEPGRILAGPAQLIILTVLDIITRDNGHTCLICDGGAMSLSPMLLTEKHIILPLEKRNTPLKKYTILGNMPSSLDKVSSLSILPEMRIGDRLAILDTGAYFVSFNNNFRGPRPAIVMIDHGHYKVIRNRETYKDMLLRDV